MTTLRCFFSILALVLMSVTSAQVICTDVNPDIVNTGNASLDIDLNNDNTADFRLTSAQVGTLAFVVVQGSQIGTGNYVLTNNNGDALALPLNAPIDINSATWTQMNSTNQSMVLIAGTTTLGPWTGANDQYLGLRLISGINTYYGWAKFSFSGVFNTYTFKEYAYQSQPGTQILAGQGCASLSNPAIISPPGPVCLGGAPVFTANTGGSPPGSYLWSIAPPASVAVIGNSMAAVSFPGPGTYTLSLTVTTGTVTGTSSTTLLVGQTPTLSVTPSATTICLSSSVSLLASGNAASYSWSPGAGLSSTTGSVVVATPLSSQVYTVVADLNGCVTQETISINLSIPPAFSVNVGGTSLCTYPFNGSPSSVTVALLNAPGYTLSAPVNSLLFFTNLSAHVVNIQALPPYPAVNTLASVTMQASNGVCSFSLPMGFNVVPNPTLIVLSHTGTACPGEPFTFIAAGTTSYSWNAGPGLSHTITSGLAVVSSNVSNTLSVYGIENGCRTTSEEFTFTIKPPAAINATNITACVTNPTVTLSATGNGTFSWFGAAGYIGTGTSVPFTHGGFGVYNFTIIANSNGCTDLAAMTVSVEMCLSAKEQGRNGTLSLYPQPAGNELFVACTRQVKTIQVFDSGGRLVFKSSPGNTTSCLSIGMLDKGMYIILVSDETGRVHRRTFLRD